MRFLPARASRAIRRRKQNQGRDRPRMYRARNGLRQFLFAHRHIIQRAVRFYMIRSNTGGQRQWTEKRQFDTESCGEQFWYGNSNFFAPRVLAIRKTWMRAHGHALFFGSTN